MEEDKKKELSSDTVALSGGVFYPELRSTIVRVAWPSLSTIKFISDTLRVFYLPIGQLKSLSISEPPSINLLWGVRVCCS